jgi:hypothetical protein
VSLASTVTLPSSPTSPLSEEHNSQPQQSSIIHSFQNIKSTMSGGKKYSKITDAILIMICKDMFPLNVVENLGFKHLLKTTAPLYKVPSRKTITTLLDNKYEIITTDFKEKLSDVPFFTITTDAWTEVNQTQSFLGITLHFLGNTAMMSGMIGVVPLEERHTALYLSQTLTDTLCDWNIPLEKIIAIVTDNGANIVKASIDTFGKSRHVRCFAHTLNLVPEKSFQNSPEISVILEKVRKIIRWFKNSVIGSDELRKMQMNDGVPEGTTLKLKQDVQTRWNSVFYMIDRFIQLSRYVSQILLDNPSGPDMIVATELNTLKELQLILKPLEIATRELSGEKYVTISKVIPIIHGIHHQIGKVTTQHEAAKHFQKLITTEMKKRFELIENVTQFAIATLLDPRFKKIHFKDFNAVAKAVRLIKNEMAGITVEAQIVEDLSEESAPVEDTDDLWDHHKLLLQQIQPEIQNEDLQSTISNEVSQYLSSSLCFLKQNPFEEWEKLKINFPRLYPIARKYLQISATSVPAERLFSKAGNIMTAKRNRLLGKRLNKLLFLGSLDINEWY